MLTVHLVDEDRRDTRLYVSFVLLVFRQVTLIFVLFPSYNKLKLKIIETRYFRTIKYKVYFYVEDEPGWHGRERNPLRDRIGSWRRNVSIESDEEVTPPNFFFFFPPHKKR